MSRTDAQLISDLERANIHPLWDRYKRITPVAPRPKDAPMHWRRRDMQVVGKGADGCIAHKTLGTVRTDRGDAYVDQCKMK